MASQSINGHSLERGLWAGIAIAAVIVALRVYAKITIKRFLADDIFMLLGLAIAIASMVFLTLSVRHGFGSDLTALDPQDRELVLKYINIQITTVTISTTSARTSFILYILSILGTKRTYQVLLWAILLIQLAGNIASAVLPLSICRDPRIIWDASVKTTCGDMSVIIPFAYFTNSFNSAADLFLAVFSAWVFWNLNLKTSMKLSLIFLLSLGLIAMVASIVKTTMLQEVPGPTSLGADGSLQLICWGYVEDIIIMTTSSIPCLRPLVITSVRKISSGAISRSYELSGVQKNTKSFTSSHQNIGFSKTPDPENDSIERILNSTSNISASGDRTLSENSYHGEPGITKQIDIHVTSNRDSKYGH